MNEYLISFFDKKGKKRTWRCVAETGEEAKRKFFDKKEDKKCVVISVKVIS